jgi:transposase
MSEQDTQSKKQRRKHGAAFKRKLIARSLQPGASVSAIALEHGINANLLFKWRRMHLRAGLGGGGDLATMGAPRAVLLPVKLDTGHNTGAPSAATTSLVSRASLGSIEIDIGGARVRLRGVVDEASVRCVLQALSALP